jgi:hypothetical protein
LLWTDVGTERDQIEFATLSYRSPLKLQDWSKGKAGANLTEHRTLSDVMLSPRDRPRPQQPVVQRPPDQPPPPPSDEQLRAQLQEWINAEFKLLRTVGNYATVQWRTHSLSWQAGMNLRKVYAEHATTALRELARDDITVLGILRDRVLLRAPSRNDRFKEKYFEVELVMADELRARPMTSLAGVSTARSGRAPGSPGAVGQRPPADADRTAPQVTTEEAELQRESRYEESTDTWFLGTDDFMDVDLDAWAMYSQPATDADGRVVGIQIRDNTPDNHPALQRGGRKGDIIKAINGVPVRTMADIRRVGREQYNSGTDVFIVDIERNGITIKKTFRVPRRKE